MPKAYGPGCPVSPTVNANSISFLPCEREFLSPPTPRIAISCLFTYPYEFKYADDITPFQEKKLESLKQEIHLGTGCAPRAENGPTKTEHKVTTALFLPSAILCIKFM